MNTYADGLQQIRLAKAQIDEACKTPGQNILLAGHSLMGGRLVELMTTGAFQEKIYLENGRLTILQRNADGTYTLEMLNDKACTTATRASRQNSRKDSGLISLDDIQCCAAMTPTSPQ